MMASQSITSESINIDTPNEDQQYNQTKRSSEFTSENHKLEINNLPTNTKYHVLRHLLERQFKLSPHKIRVGNKKAYVAFTSEKERNEALLRIDNQEWKGRYLSAKPAAPRHDPLINRLGVRSETKCDSDMRDEPISSEDVNAKVCPLWNKPYEDQLKIKEKSMITILNMGKQISKLTGSLQVSAPKLHKWITENAKICCRFDGVEPSPSLAGYRNKCEFNVDRDGSVGFRLGRYKNGSERVVQPPKDCPIIRSVMFNILEIFQTFLNDEKSTKLRGFDQVTHAGNVRQLTIRANQDNECLVIVDLNPQDLTQSELEEEVQSIVTSLTSLKEVVSIYFNISEKNHFVGADQTLKLMYGQKYLYEYLAIDENSPQKFRVGPTSFFQVNTRAAELLYRFIIDLAQLNSKSLILDVGCGTGTIGLSLAKKVSYVIGIETVESAILDAKANAIENQITNVSFFTGRAEDLINESISILKSKSEEQNHEGEIIAIVDPPRTGFNNSFMKSIRASNIKKIVYVACDPKANTNLISLCRPESKAYQGDPFIPTRAKAFDLFPYTNCCELVILYERLV